MKDALKVPHRLYKLLRHLNFDVLILIVCHFLHIFCIFFLDLLCFLINKSTHFVLAIKLAIVNVLQKEVSRVILLPLELLQIYRVLVLKNQQTSFKVLNLVLLGHLKNFKSLFVGTVQNTHDLLQFFLKIVCTLRYCHQSWCIE